MRTDERRLSAVLRVAPLLLFVWMVRSVLVPVALGAVFAMLLDPLKARLAARGPRLARAAPAVLTAGSMVLVVIPFGFIAARAVLTLQAFLSGGFGPLLDRIAAFEGHFPRFAEHLQVPVERMRAVAMEIAQRLTGALGGLVGGVASSLPGVIVDVFLFVLALYFFLRDGPAVVRWTSRLLPFRDRDTGELYESIRRTVHGALVGQLAVSAVQGGLAILALYAFEVPGALVLGIIATVISILPLVGTAPVTVGAVIYLALAGRIAAAVGMAVAAVVIGMSDNVIRPWVQSAGTRMHPLMVLLSVFGGIELMGWAGVFLGPVIAAVALWAIDLYAYDHGAPPLSAGAEDREA